MAELSEFVTCKHCRQEFRAITGSHLQAHGYRGKHPVRDYKRRFRLAHAMSDRSRMRYRERAEADWEQRGQHWTRGRLKSAIRRLHRSGRNLKLQAAPIRMVRAGERLYGSWKAA